MREWKKYHGKHNFSENANLHDDSSRANYTNLYFIKKKKIIDFLIAN